MLDLSTLNDAQRAAVLCTEGPLLVLAGAGSGKTRVLTYRIAHLVSDCGVDPSQILAITFTNKAAGEMRSRLAQMLGAQVQGMWVATFHAACVRILRAEAEALGYTRNFTIYDEDDSRRLIKEILVELDYDTQSYAPKTIRARISTAKNKQQKPDDLPDFGSAPIDRAVKQVYARLQERLLANNAMDFDDLLCNVARLFDEHLDVLRRYQDRFRYLHVDEYQDTNHVQYLIARQLAARHHNLMVVGDDDQSIYSWRGADISNILEFERDYPQATVITLEQNYRSTATILEAANGVVAHNTARKAKRLYTTASAGEKVSLYLAVNERDEARYVAGEIERLARAGTQGDRSAATQGVGYTVFAEADTVYPTPCVAPPCGYGDFAVFYRTNAQSRVIEDALLRAGIPYRIVGGTRFFDRAEIRDLMSYLKAVINPADELSLKRIINVPRRGIGARTIEAVESAARAEGVTFESAARKLVGTQEAGTQGVGYTVSAGAANTVYPSPCVPALKPAARAALADFLAALDLMRSYAGDLVNVVGMIIERSGLLAALEVHDHLPVVDDVHRPGERLGARGVRDLVAAGLPGVDAAFDGHGVGGIVRPLLHVERPYHQGLGVGAHKPKGGVLVDRGRQRLGGACGGAAAEKAFPEGREGKGGKPGHHETRNYYEADTPVPPLLGLLLHAHLIAAAAVLVCLRRLAVAACRISLAAAACLWRLAGAACRISLAGVACLRRPGGRPSSLIMPIVHTCSPAPVDKKTLKVAPLSVPTWQSLYYQYNVHFC